jgi:hypothetical protein
MGTVTIRLPDDTHKRIKDLAASKKTSINKAMNIQVYLKDILFLILIILIKLFCKSV